MLFALSPAQASQYANPEQLQTELKGTDEMRLPQ